MSFHTSALILTWVVLILMGFVIAGLVRQVHELSSATRRTGDVGLRPGSPAPGLDRLGVRPPATLLFVSEGCRTCEEVLAAAGGTVEVVYAREHPELFDRYDAIATPFAVVIDESGRVVRSGPVGSPDALTSLLGGRA
jgi:hypothetical protein